MIPEYVWLNSLLLIVVIIVSLIIKKTYIIKQLLMPLFCLIVLTIVFDNIIIAMGIVAYDFSKISGILIGLAPIEDFAYTIAAVVLTPLIWNRLQKYEK